MTGSKRVADATPDGYTMILGTVGTHAQNQTLYKKPLYNADDRFHAGRPDSPITPIAHHRASPISPANNFKEFIAYAKANQGKMQYGSAGAGSATHLACVVLNTRDGHQDRARPLQGHRPGHAGSHRAAASTSCATSSRRPRRRSTAARSKASPS